MAKWIARNALGPIKATKIKYEWIQRGEKFNIFDYDIKLSLYANNQWVNFDLNETELELWSKHFVPVEYIVITDRYKNLFVLNRWVPKEQIKKKMWVK